MIQENMNEYGLIDIKKRKAKTAFTQAITHQLVQDGFRFVVWDTKRGEFFEYNMNIEKGFNEVRNKVRQSLTDGRKKLEHDALNDNFALNDDFLGGLDEEQILQVVDPNIEIMIDIFA
ncbi:predicted protein [Chaetoceros tenuissimus]|uniref:Uncharacterized protein n=1 Tax=Chaetoceros tenuissimus TaxID=426638 RepID=A0AAD3CKA8_9STRA|nr:predicted protein [Chaetoceros tenuissimus]